MSTNPIDLKRPIAGEGQEISQPTFVEIISATRKTIRPAIGKSVPNVEDAIKTLAFGRQRISAPRPVSRSIFIPTTPEPTSLSVSSYSVRPTKSTHKELVQSLRAAKARKEFDEIIANQSVRLSLTGCPGSCPDPCPPKSTPDECAVDLAVVLDDTGSMGGVINAVKTGISRIADLLKAAVGQNFRLSLVTFKDNFTCRLPFGNACGDASLAAFQTAINSVSAGGGGDAAEASANAAYYSATGGCGCWREGDIVRAMILITDNINNTADPPNHTVQDAINACVNCSIKIAYAATPASGGSQQITEGQAYAAGTGGVFVQTPSDGSGLDSLLTSFIFNLCATSRPTPECEGGTDIIVNGKFDTDLNGWVATDAVWDGIFESPSAADPVGAGSAAISLNGKITQTITGLNGGDFLAFNYNWCVRSATSSVVKEIEAPRTPCNCNNAERISPYIVGGTIESGFPAICKVGSSSGGVDTFFCTGTLISPRHVLTACHCLNISGGSPLPIPDGDARVQFDDGTVYKSKKIYFHSTYMGAVTSPGDIAIIELESDVVGVTPINLTSARITTGPIKIIGFGGTAGTIPDTFGTKYSGDNTIDSWATTVISGTPPVTYTGSWIIYDWDVGEATAWRGDSGGPVLYDDSGTYKIIGVVSFGNVPLTTGSNVGNTEVYYYLPWVNSILSPPSSASLTVVGELLDSSDNPIPVISSWDGTISTDTDTCSTGRVGREPVKIIIPDDGIVTIMFTLTSDDITGGDYTLYVDNILLCQLKNDDCGPGSRNIVKNPNFDTGVEFWTDKNGSQIPTTDPSVWDADVFAIIVSLLGYTEIRQELTGLAPGRNYILSFDLTAHDPNTVGDLELIYGVVGGVSTTVTNNTLASPGTPPPTFPKRLTLSFIASSTAHTIYIKNGAIGGVAKIRNVLVCDMTGICEAGYSKISFDDFATSRGAWSGGVHEYEKILLNDTNDTLSQTFTGLTPASRFQVTINVKDPESVIINLITDRTDQITTPPIPGIYTVETIVQASGIVIVEIKKQSNQVYIDDILVCLENPPVCDGSITNSKIYLEWDGVPRTLVNVFNALVRYTVRNPADPSDLTYYTTLPDTEGHLGTTTCDMWKQQGSGGVAQDTILRNDMTGVSLPDVAEGDIKTISTKTNWLWSIPQVSGTMQDNLAINLPAPPPGLVESVEVLLLVNKCGGGGGSTGPKHMQINFLRCFAGIVPGPGAPFVPPGFNYTILSLPAGFDHYTITTIGDKGSGTVTTASDSEETIGDSYFAKLKDSWGAPELGECFEIVFKFYDASNNIVAEQHETGWCCPSVPPPSVPTKLSINKFSTPCSTDPAQNLNVILRYTNSLGLNKEFATTIDLNSIYPQSVNPTGWDTNTALGNGVNGSEARWESFLYELDLPNGKGLDQCTAPLTSSSSGTGELDFNKFKLIGKGRFIDSCDATVEVKLASAGTTAVNEVQSIVMPAATGGTWKLTVDYITTESVDVATPTTAVSLRTALESLSNVGSGNVKVTGTGTTADPYLVEFINTLGGINIPLMVADGSNLTGGVAFGKVTTTQNGGIPSGAGVIGIGVAAAQDDETILFEVNFPSAADGAATVEITYDTSGKKTVTFDNAFTRAQQIKELENAFGTGNVWLTSTGPTQTSISSWVASVLAPRILDPSTLSHTFAVTRGIAVDGGVTFPVSRNKWESVDVQATSGTFTLTFDGQTTKRIPFDASLSDVLSALIELSNIDTSDVNGYYYDGIYYIEFTGVYAGIDAPLLTGMWYPATIGINEIQKITIQATKGTFTLTFDDPFGEATARSSIHVFEIDSAVPIPPGIAPSVTITVSNPITGLLIDKFDWTWIDEASLDLIATGINTILATVSPSGETWTVDGSYTRNGKYNLTLTASGNLANRKLTTANTDGYGWIGINDPTSNPEFAQKSYDPGANLASTYTTKDISFNAFDTDVKSAITEAPFYSNWPDSISVIYGAEALGMKEWIIEWVDQFRGINVNQMSITASGLSGGFITVNSVTDGSGTTSSQYVTVKKAVGGSFKLSVTWNGITATTTPIPWNTDSYGLQAQLNALPMFIGIVDAVIVLPVPTTGDEVNKFEVSFLPSFGPIALMVPDFEETLLCKPIVLTPVDPGPYPYEPPICEDDDLSCQSGPLFCKPGEGEEPAPIAICCNGETIPAHVDFATKIFIERDLFDPNRVGCKGTLTVRDLALQKNLKLEEYIPYARDFLTGKLEKVLYSKQVATGQSYVLVANELDSDSGRASVMAQVRNREILPSRMVWPAGDF